MVPSSAVVGAAVEGAAVGACPELISIVSPGVLDFFSAFVSLVFASLAFVALEADSV